MNLIAVPAREINMDGDLHVTGVCCGYGAIMGRDCRRCGGVIHQQTIYGGIMESCEDCDAVAWEPFGTFGTDKDGFVDHQQTIEAIRWRGEDGIVHLAWVGKWRFAFGCGLAPFPRPVPVEDPYPTCFECIVNGASRTRFRQP